MKSLLKQPDLTAIFITNYEMTLGGIIAINELGVQIPQQISLIGFDNLHLSKVIQPKLTIVTQPLEEIGTKAAEILVEQLVPGANRQETQIVTLSTGICTGNSVAQLDAVL